MSNIYTHHVTFAGTKRKKMYFPQSDESVMYQILQASASVLQQGVENHARCSGTVGLRVHQTIKQHKQQGAQLLLGQTLTDDLKHKRQGEWEKASVLQGNITFRQFTLVSSEQVWYKTEWSGLLSFSRISKRPSTESSLWSSEKPVKERKMEEARYFSKCFQNKNNSVNKFIMTLSIWSPP